MMLIVSCGDILTNWKRMAMVRSLKQTRVMSLINDVRGTSLLLSVFDKSSSWETAHVQ